MEAHPSDSRRPLLLPHRLKGNCVDGRQRLATRIRPRLMSGTSALRIVGHALAYLLAVCGGLVVLFVASPVPALLGLAWPRGLILALPFAIAASIGPYLVALWLLRIGGGRSLNLRLLAGGLVALASVGLLAWALDLDAMRHLLGSRGLIGNLLAGAVGAYIQGQVADAFGLTDKGAPP